MPRKKLKRFVDIKSSDLVLENSQNRFEKIKENWETEFGFKPPFVLELGCGAGEYTVGIAAKFPAKKVIGIDIKGERIWKGVQKIQEEKLKNALFIRSQIDHIQKFFPEKSIQEIWITFPDPRPKTKDEKRRLTSPKFLVVYAPLLLENGVINLKTDSQELYEYTLSLMGKELVLENNSENSNLNSSSEQNSQFPKKILEKNKNPQKYKIELIESTNDLYNSDLLEKAYGIQTTYEKRFLKEDKPITLLRFKLVRF